MTDKIKIGADLDTAEVTKKLSELQNKLKGMMGAQATLGDSPRDMQMKQAFQRSEGIYRDQMKKKYEEQGKIVNDLLKKERELSEQLDGKIKSQKKLNELTQEYLQITNQINQARNNQQTAAQNICPPGMRYNPQTKTCDPDPTGGGGGPIPPGGGGIGGKLMGAMGAVTSVASAAKAMSDMADFINRRRGEYSAERSASLAESMYAPSRRAIRGEGFNDLLFAEEKNKALTDAMKMGEGQFGINRGKAIGSGIAGTAGIGIGLTALAALAAAPLTGGASLLGLSGMGMAGLGLGSMAAGGYALSANKGMGYEAIFGNMGEVDKMTGEQIMTNYQKNIAREKAQDPIKTMLKDFIEENRGEMIKGIRGSGMSEQEYMRRYVQGYGMYGSGDFSFQQRTGMTNQMLGAGGGSGAAYGQNMITALQAQRSLGLTNAGQTMGRLSNYLNAQESEEAFIKILGKGVSIGLDKSQYREEQKDYFNQVTAIAQNIGAGEQLISSIMTAAIGNEGDISRKNVEFAADAAKDIMGDLGQTSGRIGAQKYRELNKNEYAKNLSKEDRFFLGQMNPADIEAGNPELEMYWRKSGAAKAGVSIEDFAKSIRGSFSKAVTSGFGKMTERYQEIQQMMDKGVNKKGEKLTDVQLKDLEVEKTRLYSFMADKQGTYEARRARERGLSGFEDKMGVGKGFEDRISEYNQLKTNEQFLNEEQKARLQELEGTSAAFRGRPESAMEGILGNTNQMQQQVLREITAAGKDLAGVVGDLSKNLDEALTMNVKDRALLSGFQKALEDGAKDVIDAMLAKITGSTKLGKNTPNINQASNTQRATTQATGLKPQGRGI